MSSALEVTEEFAVPVDKGYAWLILFASQIVSFLYVGTLRSSGIFFIEYLNTFKASASMTSLVSGIQIGFNSIVLLPLMVFGIKKFTVRQCVMLGGCLMSFSYILSSFAGSIEYLIFSQSFVFGVGSALVYSPSMVIIARYFDKQRGFANGMFIAASSLGGLVLPFFFRLVIDTYGLSGGMLVTAGLLLNTVVAGCLQRPPEYYFRKIIQPTTKLLECEKTILSIQNNSVDLGTDKLYFELSPNNVTRLFSSHPLIINPPESSSNNPNVVRGLSIFSNSEPCVNEKYLQEETNLHLSNTEFASLADLSTKREFPKGQNKKEVIDKQNIFKEFLAALYDKDIMLNKSFLLFISAFCFGSINGALAFIYIPKFALENGIDLFSSTLLVSIIGGCDFVGRIISGLLCDWKRINNHHIIIVSQIFASVVMHLSRLCRGYASFVAFSSIFGLFAGMLFSLYPVIIVDITGKHKLPVGLALTMMSQGAAISASTPILGYLRDVTGTYYATFHFVGTTSLISAVLLLFMPYVEKKTKNVIQELEIECGCD